MPTGATAFHLSGNIYTGATLGGLILGLAYLGSPVLAVGLYVALEISCELIWLKLAFICGGFDLSELRSTPSVGRLAMLISVLMFVCRLVAQPLDIIISIVVALFAVLLIGLRYLNARDSGSMQMMPRRSNLPLPD